MGDIFRKLKKPFILLTLYNQASEEKFNFVVKCNCKIFNTNFRSVTSPAPSVSSVASMSSVPSTSGANSNNQASKESSTMASNCPPTEEIHSFPVVWNEEATLILLEEMKRKHQYFKGKNSKRMVVLKQIAKKLKDAVSM